MLSMSPHKIVGCSTMEKNVSRFQTNLLIFWLSKLLNSIELYLIGENEAYKISILVFFCIYKQCAREIQSAKRDLAKHQYRIRILCLDYLATLSKELIDFQRTKTHRLIKEENLVFHRNLTLFWMTQFGLLCCALSGSSKTS